MGGIKCSSLSCWLHVENWLIIKWTFKAVTIFGSLYSVWNMRCVYNIVAINVSSILHYHLFLIRILQEIKKLILGPRCDCWLIFLNAQFYKQWIMIRIVELHKRNTCVWTCQGQSFCLSKVDLYLSSGRAYFSPSASVSHGKLLSATWHDPSILRFGSPSRGHSKRNMQRVTR